MIEVEILHSSNILDMKIAWQLLPSIKNNSNYNKVIYIILIVVDWTVVSLEAPSVPPPLELSYENDTL